ncbi:MAG: hypothetical protein RLZZ179_3177 [Verrucomicrobiota bacterium]
MLERALNAPPRFSRRRFLAASGAATTSVVVGLQPRKLAAQTFANETGSGSSAELRTVSQDVIQFGMVLKELPGPSLSFQPCNNGRLFQVCEPVGWFPNGTWEGWRDLRPSDLKELETTIPAYKVHTSQKSFQSKGFAFWTANASFTPPTTQQGISTLVAPQGATSTAKGTTPAGTAELEIKQGQQNPWSSKWYDTTSRDPGDNPAVPTIKYTGSSHDGGLVAGTVGCVANWIGNGWNWQGSHATNGSLSKTNVNLPTPVGTVGFEYQSTDSATVDKTAGIPLQWNFVVVSRKRVDTKQQKRPDSKPAWVDVPGSEKEGSWGPWNRKNSEK